MTGYRDTRLANHAATTDGTLASPMSTTPSPDVLNPPKTVALVGNPNTGKTTLFNALTGFRQRVGNYPGITVERKTGAIRHELGETQLQAIDLPGAYSLNAQSADEAVVLEVLSGHDPSSPTPDLLVSVVDATNLARNLFFTSQLLELGMPAVVALNMVDAAEAKGLTIDAEALALALGVPVVPVVASKGIGVDSLKKAVIDALAAPVTAQCPSFPACVCSELDGLCESVGHADGECPTAGAPSERAALLQTLLDPGGHHEEQLIKRCGVRLADELAQRRQRIADSGESIVEVEAKIRYAWIERVVGDVVKRVRPPRKPRTEKVDSVLTHPIYGFVALIVVMTVCFQAVYTWAGPLMEAIDGVFSQVGAWLTAVLPAGPIQSLIVNGAVAGVGAVLVFLPQILILFLFIAILEDCGYMARAAFLLDRTMSKLGLNGKSFIPLLSSFACAVPGILAARTIEDRRSRFVTIMIAPLMSCSARLPVYTLLIAAFIPAKPLLGGFIGLQAAVMLGLYALGAIVAVVVALILQRTVLQGAAPPFLLELPSYNLPTPATVLYRVYEQGREFCISAGTVIFGVSIVVWALGYYPHPTSIAADHEAQRIAARQSAPSPEFLDMRLTEIDRSEAGNYLRHSLLGRMGRWIEPVVEPLGWDWRIGTAAIASFPAREVVIATMGTIYNLGDDQDENSIGIRAKLHSASWPDGRPIFNTAVALSIMVFFALCCQCGATLATIKRETNSWRWPLFTFAYMTALAYVGALVTYQVASRLI